MMWTPKASRSVIAAVILGVALCPACRAQPAPSAGAEQGGAGPPAAAYVPLYGSRTGAARDAGGSLRGDFQRALDAGTLPEAASRWREFLTRHSPPGREFEDNMHASYAQAARYELMRIYYLLGKTEEGDALLRELDPVGWFK